MKKNMGTIDRGIRISLAIVVAALYLTNVIDGLTAIVLGVVALVFLVTSLVSICPLYSLLGIRSCTDCNDAVATER